LLRGTEKKRGKRGQPTDGEKVKEDQQKRIVVRNRKQSRKDRKKKSANNDGGVGVSGGRLGSWKGGKSERPLLRKKRGGSRKTGDLPTQ